MTASTAPVPAAGAAIYRVESTPQFVRCLEKLRARPGRPAEAAAKADRVLLAFASGRASALREAGALTAWGERRVVGCGKFNLGGGYRLIYSRRGGTVVPQFVGNHEECHRWLSANRGLDLRPDRGVRSAPTAEGSTGSKEDELQEFQPSSDYPGITLSDRELRKVFAGLCGAASNPPSPTGAVLRQQHGTGLKEPLMLLPLKEAP